MSRRCFFSAAGVFLAAALSGPALANTEARVVGIVSLVADFLTVTGFESSTGSQLASSNPNERIELRDDALERAVLRAGLRAVGEAKAGKAVPLLINDGAVYDAQDRMVSGEQARIPASLLATLQAQQATHLLLVTKHRAEARMKTGVVEVGTGRVQGLGFYVDRVTPLTRLETGESSVGYLAPHVYVRLSLIDLRDSKVLRTRTVTASWVYTASSKDRGADPWDVLDSAGKMKALGELISNGCAPALRELLAS
jgi:hypothetical protein